MKRILLALLIGVLCKFSYASTPFIPSPTNADKPANCQLHKLYCKILELQPELDPQWAMKLSNSLLKHARQYKMDPWLSLAIAMQESSLQPPKKKIKLIAFTKHCDKNKQCETKHKVVEGYSDLSIFQLHVNTILDNDIDPVRLRHDLDYAVDWHYRILARKLEQCEHLGIEAWGCYHSNTPVLHKRYVKMVSRYYYGNETIRKQPQVIVSNDSEQETSKLSQWATSIRNKINNLGDSLANKTK